MFQSLYGLNMSQKFHCNMMKGMRIQLKRLKERGGLGGGKQFIFVNNHGPVTTIDIRVVLQSVVQSFTFIILDLKHDKND